MRRSVNSGGHRRTQFFFSPFPTISRPFDFHGNNERFPSEYRIDRELEQRPDIFVRNNGNDFCDHKRNLSRADISFLYEFDFYLIVKLRSFSAPLDDCFLVLFIYLFIYSIYGDELSLA